MTKVITALLFGLFAYSIYAKDFGAQAQVWPIAEMDFLDFIEGRLHTMQENGALEKAKEDFIERAKSHIERPQPVGLTTQQRHRRFYYDPTFTLKRDLDDGNGHVFAKHGKRINPLELLPSFATTLFFIDGDNRAEVSWLKRQLNSLHKVKVILVAGNIKQAETLLQTPIYFDLHGRLSQKLGVAHHPASVKRSGNRLVIDEFSIEEVHRGAF